ncbi:hypothetical protein WJ969_10955 [Achromobacter xylosoxidans]
MFPLRPLSALFLFACTLPAHAAEECVARFDAGVARYQEAVGVQKGRETANWQELNGLLCQGRLDLLDMEFALVDDYEQCARNGGKFPEQTARNAGPLGQPGRAQERVDRHLRPLHEAIARPPQRAGGLRALRNGQARQAAVAAAGRGKKMARAGSKS